MPLPSLQDPGATLPFTRTPQRMEEATQSRGNWRWLVELTGNLRALEIAGPDSPLPGALAPWFAEVRSIAVPVSPRLTEPDASLDCVAIHDGMWMLSSEFGIQLLHECRRVLRLGGWLFLSGANSAWAGTREAGGRRWTGHILRQLARTAPSVRAARQAGFGEVRRYFAWPSLVAPRMFIPADARGVAAHERLECKHSNRGRTRAWVAAGGLGAVLYPVEIILCRR